MSKQNEISIVIPETVITEANELIDKLEVLFNPYMKPIPKGKKKFLVKLGNVSFSFVAKVLKYIISNPEFIPAFMDKLEFEKDAKAAEDLRPILNRVEQLASNLKDTRTLCGSDAYQAALQYYSSVSFAEQNDVQNAKMVRQDLAEFFKKSSSGIAMNPTKE